MATLAVWAEPGRAALAPMFAAEVEAFLALARGGVSCPAMGAGASW